MFICQFLIFNWLICQFLKIGLYSIQRFIIVTVSSSTNKLLKSSYRTDSYGKNYIIVSAIN